MLNIKYLQQFKNNAVAIASIIVAVAGLGYNTWRNEASEINRNTRIAAFESLKQLNELQLIVNAAHYDLDKIQGNPIQGWGRVVFVRDLAMVLPEPAEKDAQELYDTWENNWNSLGITNKGGNEAVENITAKIMQNREHLAVILKRLK